MFGLTPLGIFHTAISLIAVAAGEALGCSASFLFHLIPALTETTTRLPPGAPWLASAEAPQLQTATALMFGLFLIREWRF